MGDLDGFYLGTAVYAGVGVLMCIFIPLYAGATTDKPKNNKGEIDQQMVSDNKW